MAVDPGVPRVEPETANGPTRRAPSLAARWRGWPRSDRLAAIGLLLACVGTVAGVLAVPGLMSTSEPGVASSSSSTAARHRALLASAVREAWTPTHNTLTALAQLRMVGDLAVEAQGTEVSFKQPGGLGIRMDLDPHALPPLPDLSDERVTGGLGADEVRRAAAFVSAEAYFRHQLTRFIEAGGHPRERLSRLDTAASEADRLGLEALCVLGGSPDERTYDTHC